jgi:hypothetical protein
MMPLVRRQGKKRESSPWKQISHQCRNSSLRCVDCRIFYVRNWDKVCIYICFSKTVILWTTLPGLWNKTQSIFLYSSLSNVLQIYNE